MKKCLVLICAMAVLGGCSSTGNIKVISPSTPEDEVKEKVHKAPVTKLQVVSEADVKDRQQAPPPSAQAPAEAPSKASVTAVPDHAAAASAPSIRSQHALEALINILEKKGLIQNEELLEEIRKLDEKDRTK